MSSATYGFTEPTGPAQARTVAINITHLKGTDERVGSLLGRIFAVQSEAVALSRELLADEIASVEVEHEAARIAGRNARDAFENHRRMELQYQNAVSNAQAKLSGANRLVVAWQDAKMDPYASKSERAARSKQIDDERLKAAECEAELINVVQDQNLYYGQGEHLANEYNAAQAKFVSLDSRLNTLKQHLEQLQAEN